MTASVPHTNPARLLEVARQMSVVTADEASHDDLEPLSRFLAEVRQSMGMDVAFVSRFDGDLRRFQVVSVAPGSDPVVAAGGADALADTFCKLVVEGRLPLVVHDATEHPLAASMPITSRLRLRAYLSARIVLESGMVFGTLCCFSHAPRPDLQDLDAAALQAIADAMAANLDRHGRLTASLRRWD